MKMCIELDDDMLKSWESVRWDLSSIFKQFKGICTPIEDTTVFRALLYCYEYDIEGLPIRFVTKLKATD
jgi:hypothetical protein